MTFDLSTYGIRAPLVLRNPSVPLLYEHGLADGDLITASGALAAYSGSKTGRSPKDKRIVEHPDSRGDIWWGSVNIPSDEAAFAANRQRAIEFLDGCRRLYAIDGYAGWDVRRRLKIRVICARPYHALFMWNMLIRPTASELADFAEPEYVIYNAGQQPADATLPGNTSDTVVALSLERGEFVLLGTEYAGEMKKGVFTIMNYLMPKRGVLSMHCAANEGPRGDSTLFFGLSGTGKTTLSADVRRKLIGDDEHCWADNGIFNIEGGCYAKCIKLSGEREPEIYSAIRFGSVLENVVIDPLTRLVDYADDSITENTRASYPIEYIQKAKIPCRGGHPRNVVLLTCDAFGILPPVARLTPEQAMYHFVSGYTAKVAGTEVGVREPLATFSACFGAAFLVWHPTRYAEMLSERLRAHQAQAWLVNTGWTGGAYGVGKRISLAHTRAMIDAIHDETVDDGGWIEDQVFGMEVPRRVPGVPDRLLLPENTWPQREAYRRAAAQLAGLFIENFRQYESSASEATRAAGPRTLAPAN